MLNGTDNSKSLQTQSYEILTTKKKNHIKANVSKYRYMYMYIIMIHTHFKSQRKQLFIFDRSCMWITYCKIFCLIHVHAQSYINFGWGIFKKWKLLLRKWSKTFFNIEDEEIHVCVSYANPQQQYEMGSKYLWIYLLQCCLSI